MNTQPIFAQYGFENLIEFFYYIVDSKINGNPSQVKQLLTEMLPDQVEAFIKFETGHSDLVKDLQYCKDIAVHILAEKVTAATTPAPGIKTLDITAKEWRDKVNGNSYFSAQITVNFGMEDESSIFLPFQYGYGDHYRDMAFKALQDNGLIPAGQDRIVSWRYYQENNIIARHTKHEKCLKRDVIAWGAK